MRPALWWWSWMVCSALVGCSSGDGASTATPDADGGAGAGGSTTTHGGGAAGGSGAPSGGAQGSGGSGAVDPTASPRAACRAYLRAACQRFEDCGIGSPSCADLLDRCPDYLFSPGSTRTLAAVVACTPEWANFPCGEVRAGGSPSCSTPGTRKAGETCLFRSQCESVGCTASTADPSACGTCNPLAASGGACSTGTECPLGQYCSGTCGPAASVAPLPPPGGPGDPCSSRCVPGYVCQDNTCVPFPGPGSPCGGGGYVCSANAYCNTSLVCTVLPVAGEACGIAAQSGGVKCAAGAVCDNATVLCTQRVPLGGTCRPAYEECIEGTDCVSDGQPAGYRCVRMVEEGEACTGVNDHCVAATSCQAGRCVASGDLGLFAACRP